MMTPEQINIAIAESTGLSGDFFHDLNAIHTAIMSLSDVQKYHYVRWLDEITEPTGEAKFQDWSPVRVVEATIEQKRESFLRTIEKWVGK